MLIEAEGLSKIYYGKVAVESVDLAVQKGQVYGFLGPNGAGKSTCIKMLTGLVFPTAGKATVLGRPLGDAKAREKMGYLPELFRFQEWMTGTDLLDFHSSLYRLKKDPARNKRVLERVGLLGQEKFKVGTYSKGMQQRLGIACALLPDPELLLLDEPTSALDPVGRKLVRDIILSLQREGTTVFLNSHLLSEVEAVCNGITIISKGVVVKSGSMSDILQEKVSLSIKCSNISESVYSILKNRFDASIKPQGSDGELFLKLNSKDEVPDIAELLAASSVRIFELTPRHETLESVFLKVVDKEADA
ncbi:MAG: ABC transporter ATP-binding protein [Clostridiales bacterium]|jgi:ABC-2 type transport system ATP-binding protein|nr:ABC transporter ATP-binding protein [Clostridiales bacterium]